MEDPQWLDKVLTIAFARVSDNEMLPSDAISEAKVAIAAKLNQAYDSGLRQFSQDQQKAMEQVELEAMLDAVRGLHQSYLNDENFDEEDFQIVEANLTAELKAQLTQKGDGDA